MRKIIQELNRCHEEHPFRKFVGACNDLKRALNACLQKEYVEKRRKNYELAQKKRRQRSKNSTGRSELVLIKAHHDR